jgi:hypothetical protein
MAFNPFNVFRRNQKILFAVLTVFIMLMFTLQFGQGDLFSSLPRWIGSMKRSGPVMAVVDGSKVYQSELERLQRQRVLANQYMYEAGTRADGNLAKYLSEGVGRASTENRPLFQELMTVRQSGYMSRAIQQKAQMAQLGFGPPVTREDQVIDVTQTIGYLQRSLAEVMKSSAATPADKELAEVAAALIDLDLRLGGGSAQYFNQPNRTQRDAMDFLLWLRKADQLGVSFSRDDVEKLVGGEFLGRVAPEELAAIREGMRNKAGYSAAALRDALADEFKVRAAQAAVMGQEYLHPIGRVYDDPYDYYAFYKEQVSPARYGMISVPVANYLDKVQGQPTETELRDIFNKYRNQEPSPQLARPGLKEPRKLKLEWVEITGEEPYYKKAADAGALQAAAMVRLDPFLAAAAAGGGISSAGLLGAPAVLTLKDPVLAAKYANFVQRYQSHTGQDWYREPSPFPPFNLPEVGVKQPENAGAAAGAAGAAARAYAANRKVRLQTLPAGFVVPAAPGWGGVEWYIANAVVQAKATQPPPLDAVRTKLAKEALADIARAIAAADMANFERELAKLGAKADKSDAKAYAEKFVRERGLRHGESQQFLDVYHIVNDPGLKPLKEKMDEAQRAHAQAGFVDPALFGGRFFFDVVMDPRGGRRLQPSAGLYKPKPFPEASADGPQPGEPAFVVWRVAEQPAEAPRDFNSPAVKAKAEAAWREAKARELAKKAADELAKKCENLGNSFFEIEQKLRDARAQFAGQFSSPQAKERVKYFEIDGVAPLVPGSGMQNAMIPGRDTVGPFQLMPSENIPYPSQAMAEALVTNKDKPLSTALVVADQPEDAYYVAVLANRNEARPEDFYAKVYSPIASGELAATIFRRHQDEVKRRTRDEALAMLKAEFRYEKESEKLNEKSESFE